MYWDNDEYISGEYFSSNVSNDWLREQIRIAEEEGEYDPDLEDYYNELESRPDGMDEYERRCREQARMEPEDIYLASLQEEELEDEYENECEYAEYINSILFFEEEDTI